MRVTIRRASVNCLAAATAVAWGLSATGMAPAKDLQDWYGFGKGSWRQVRVVNETLDEKGRVVDTSTTETRTTVVNVASDEVTLRVVTTVEVSGKRFDASTSQLIQGPHGELNGEKALARPLDAEKVTVEGQSFDCRAEQVVIESGDQRRVVRTAYAQRAAPVALRQVETVTDQKNETVSTATSEVIALDMPYRVLMEMKPAVYARTVHKNHKGTTTTLAVYCADVPGMLVSYSAKEVDATGRVIRRSTFELVQYEVVPEGATSGGIGSRIKLRREERRSRR